jgi:chromosome segregation ATPase
MDVDKVKELIKDVLKQSAEAGLQADVEEALKEAEKSVSDLTDKIAEVEAKAATDTATIETLESSKSELETELAAKKEEITSLTTEKESLLERAEKAENVLDTMKKDKLVSDRLTELTELKVARAGEALEAQTQLIREMSEEEFAAYKTDMVALREELLISVKADIESANVNNDSKGTETNTEGDAGVTTPPADVEGTLENASAAMPNAENADGSKKWDWFSVNFAKHLREQRGEETIGG